jgi:hypothetical protein
MRNLKAAFCWKVDTLTSRRAQSYLLFQALLLSHARVSEMSSGSCERCEQLLTEYREAIARFVRASKELSKASLNPESELLRTLLSEADAEHGRCEELRKLFLTHFKSHSSG